MKQSDCAFTPAFYVMFPAVSREEGKRPWMSQRRRPREEPETIEPAYASARILVRSAAFRLERPLRRCRIFREHFREARGPLNEISAAIRAYAIELGVRAVATESAFERADQRVAAVGWQITIAAFAPRFEQ
jgi:hypothetical protein